MSFAGKPRGDVLGEGTILGAKDGQSHTVSAGIAYEEGWVWRARRRPFGERVGMHVSDDRDDEGWQEESDKVQWFRAEADFFRWLEQLERKHFEFVRLIGSFRWYVEIWTGRRQKSSGNAGLAAFASRQAAVYEAMLDDAYSLFRGVAHPKLVGDRSDIRSLNHQALVRNCLDLRREFMSDVHLLPY